MIGSLRGSGQCCGAHNDEKGGCRNIGETDHQSWRQQIRQA